MKLLMKGEHDEYSAWSTNTLSMSVNETFVDVRYDVIMSLAVQYDRLPIRYVWNGIVVIEFVGLCSSNDAMK